MNEKFHKGFATDITLAMFFALIAGYLLYLFPEGSLVKIFLVDDLFQIVGKIFITLLKMVVVPIVFVSIVCGVANNHDIKSLGKISGMTFILYLVTTAIAITMALFIANIAGVGQGVGLGEAANLTIPLAPSIGDVILNIFPDNPFKALVRGDMLQVIFFAVLLGVAAVCSGDAGKRVTSGFNDFNDIIVNIVMMVMRVAPIGVFCLLAAMVAKTGFGLVQQLAGYFLIVLTVLFLHVFLVYGSILAVFARVSITSFLHKVAPAMLFAFSLSSSNAALPVVIQTARDRLKLSESVLSFVIPLGATINMDGTAIMQGVATVFIANAYGIDISIFGYATIVLMATIASIGTAGVPGVGLVTLAMVLAQVGLPVEGIAMIIAVDRILDMTRTAVNIAGDCAVATVVDSFIDDKITDDLIDQA